MGEDNPFDKTARRMAKSDAILFIAWLVGMLPTQFRFRGWADARLARFPNEPDRVCDMVADLETLLGMPWAVLLEFQIRPLALMFGRIQVYLGSFWETTKPSELVGDRYNVAAIVVNLTGRGRTQTEASWPEANIHARYPIIERNLCDYSAAQVLQEIEAGLAPKMALGWIPLMQNGSAPDIIEQWLKIALAEPERVRRSDYGTFALVFAEAAGSSEVWQKALEGWNVMESKQILEWTAEARDIGKKEGIDIGKKEGIDIGKKEGELQARRQLLLRLGQHKFNRLTTATQKRIEALDDLARLDRLIDALLTASTWKELLATK